MISRKPKALMEDAGHHKTTVYWATRAMLPSYGYEPIDANGQVYGFTVCMPEVVEKVCNKMRKDYIETSQSRSDKLPIWC